MTRNTRYFMAGSAAVLVAGLCTGLVAYYGGGFQALSASTGPIELRYVPPDAAVIAYADVGAIMNSELRLRIKEAMPMQQKGQEEFQRETGIDIERDIQYVVAAVTPGTHSALLVARGNFNPRLSRVWPFSTAASSRPTGQAADFQGRRRARAERRHPGVPRAGPGRHRRHRHRQARHRRAADRTSVISNDEIMTLVSDIEHGNNAWAVGRVDALTAHAKLPEQIAKQIPPVKWFAAAGHINGGVSGMVRLEANDDESAELLRRQINGALAFGEMVGRSDPRASAAPQDGPDERLGQDGSALVCRAGRPAPDGAAEKSGCSNRGSLSTKLHAGLDARD